MKEQFGKTKAQGLVFLNELFFIEVLVQKGFATFA